MPRKKGSTKHGKRPRSRERPPTTPRSFNLSNNPGEKKESKSASVARGKNKMPPFKDEHVLIIAPGSQTTLAQLGLPESFTPAQWRFPTRMFPAAKEGEWEPHKIREKKISATTNGTTNGASAPPAGTDVEMTDQPTTDGAETKQEDATAQDEKTQEETTTFEEDPESVEGAVYPIQQGRIENWPCFLALLSHIYNTLSPPFHTPVLLVAQPCWTYRDHEFITQFFFENFKIPAFCLIDSALASCYAFSVPSATVVDVGYEKCDVTAVSEFVPQLEGRGTAMLGCGGEAMTERLLELLGPKGFDRQMCEQLKKSGICEILPPGIPMPGQLEGAAATETYPAAVASTGAQAPGPDATEADGKPLGQAPRGPGIGREVGDERREDLEDNEGVLDVASIVARGDASEFLAKREKEKQEKAATSKKGAASAETNKPTRLRNAERQRATFQYEEYVPVEEGVANGTPHLKKRKRDVEVGLERFLAATAKSGATYDLLDTIAGIMYRTIMKFPDPAKRSELWDNVIIVGNGSRIKGFKEALLSTLTSKYVLSPSSATIFTSELPSNLSTPLPTGGTNTPLGPPTQPMHHPAAHGVNPLLVAATHANQGLPPQSLQVPQNGLEHYHHRGYNQTPTSIKTVKAPEYFPEWKDPKFNGMEEAEFLGAQVAAKVIYVVDQGVSKGFLTRSDYNEMGPGGIHDFSL